MNLVDLSMHIFLNNGMVNETNASEGVTKISTGNVCTRAVTYSLKGALIGINEKQLQRGTINENTICEMGKLIFANLVKKTPDHKWLKKSI
ncbi:hypothetical protein NPIL_650351 [Nephila pilipes]|uniref:Uncharacterized protein n=1 Tax=Nephila pilipes TaxID=299642 RepID=A0A8X6USY9_NEPPI|nr:hypothetical protein NPIL_650351 [Nephila pilipes]